MSLETQPQVEYRPAGSLDTGQALLPYRGPWGERQAAHLLRRAGFGGSPQEIRSARDAGLHDSVDRLLNFVADNLPAQPQGDISFGGPFDLSRRRAAYITTEMWWLNRMLLTPNPLQERMVYFWSNHFTSGLGQKGITPDMLVSQYALFRKYALGNYAQLTHDVSRDPAMLHYLDGIANRKQHPNENYARELMELFTMGVGNYSEEDVRQSARSFTGFSVDRFTQAFVFNPRAHDDGDKTFLGRTGNFDGDNIVDIIMEQPATARFMAKKFLRHFVYDDPEPALVDALAQKFRASNYDVAKLMSIVLRSNVFYSERAYRALVKSPLELAIGALKTLGATQVGVRTLGALPTMGQIPMAPPNVAGWPGGALWLNTGTYLARRNYLHQLVSFKPSAGDAAPGPQMMSSMDASAALQNAVAGQLASPETWVAGATASDPLSVMERVVDTTLQGDATSEQQQNILNYLATDGVGNRVALNGENFEEKVRGAMSLAMTIPTYQLA